MEKLIENFKAHINAEEIGIVHSTTPEEAQSLKNRLSAVLDSRHIYLSRLGPRWACMAGRHADNGAQGKAAGGQRRGEQGQEANQSALFPRAAP
jgi:hypothetical protein